jgi:hypothetical protein
MVDTFTAYSWGWATVDGLREQTWTASYTTRGRVSGRSRDGDTNTRTVDIGGSERPVLEGGLHIPITAGLPAIGWEFECTAVGAGTDPTLLGRRWHVVEVPAKSHATARRLDVVEVPSG